MSNVIFYFSGTGNSYSIAKGIQKEIGDTILAPLLKAKDYKVAEYNMVGFVFPVYYTHAPEIALKAIKGISLRNGQQVFAIAAYAGSLGYALQDIREALSDKQRSLFGELGSNFYAKEQCVHCYQCVKLCPTKNITISEGNLTWGNKCAQCMACIQWCHQNAVSHPLMKKNRRYYTNPNVVVNQSGELELKDHIIKLYNQQ